MKKIFIIVLCFLLGSFLSCKKAIVENRLIGEWKYEYETLDDGTKKYDNPYALLEFAYSDGFILYKDGTGHSMWYGKINEPEKFEWSNTKNKLTIVKVSSNNITSTFEYLITKVKKNNMVLESPNGNKYCMNKQ